MSTLAQTYWNFTCKFCDVIRKVLLASFVGIIAIGENAGRARAASELARMGYYDEAKILMLKHTEESTNGI